jgi:hypothetical protein
MPLRGGSWCFEAMMDVLGLQSGTCEGTIRESDIDIFDVGMVVS